ncbi:MAG: hypothetical protein KBT19_05045 [Lachnospiraceae bacterium]|nr:hypothetical protein [Candidatus Colinaster equi]
MQQFSLLSEGYLCLFGCWAMILLWGAVLIFVGDNLVKRNLPLWLRNILYDLLIIGTYLNFQCVAAVSYKKISDPFLSMIVSCYGTLPVYAMAGIYIAGTILEVWLIYISTSWNRTHITNRSIKEAFDTLPSGIVCFDAHGKIIFKNRTMDRLCQKLTGKFLLNGRQFEEVAFSHSEIEVSNELPTDDKILRLLSENEAWCFYRTSITDGSVTYSMLDAVDISEEYEKTRFLEKQQESVKQLNRKLSEYHDDILLAITAKEKLNAKIKIHDELGAGLLSIKRYLTSGGSKEERNAILERISGSIDYLKRESEDETGDEYDLMLSTAKTLGVDVKIQGELPLGNPEKHIVATAIHECFTNTLRHAGGDALYIDITDNNDGRCAVFTNNGAQPKEQIVEKGGLLSLRKLVEGAGGTMDILINPMFSLKICIPKEDDEYGLQGFNS